MPVTKSRTAFYDIDNLDQANTTGFLFRDDETAPEGKLYTQSTTEDTYSNLLRQNNMVSFVHSISFCISLSSRFEFPKQPSAAQSIAGQLKGSLAVEFCAKKHPLLLL